MACNCKRVEKLGTSMPEAKVEMSLWDRFTTLLLKIFYGFIIVIMTIIVVPVAIVIVTYKLLVKERVSLSMPKFLMKYLEKQ